jgi:aminodeoxyfutalosine deaminase
LLGLPQEQTARALNNAGEWLAARKATATCRPGLSPHAPYSVSERLFMAVGNMASAGWKVPFPTQRPPIPIAVHLAETAAELELLERRSGPFVPFLEELGVWAPEQLVANTQRVMDLCDQRDPQLYVHGNYLNPSSRFPSQGTIVYCPRTHAAFGHPPHPLVDFLKRGIRVAIGTDSLASNPDLDVLAELRHVSEHRPEVDGATLLRMATLDGARALGWEKETGSLETGKSADFVAVPLTEPSATNPYQALFQSTEPRVVFFRGQWVSGSLPLNP